MQYFLRLLLMLYLGLFASWLNIPAIAQTQTTPNLINPDGTAWGIPSSQVLPQGQITQVEGAGYTTGTAYYNSNTNTIRFSYLPSTVAQTIAINQALSGTGIAVTGFNWYYLWMNGGYSSGTLTGSISMTDSSNSVVEMQTFSHPVQPADTWNVESGTRTFNNPYAQSSLGSITMSFSGQDDRFWMGLYGPRVRDPSLTLNYKVDVCVTNPLSSPDCPGYAAAYFNQQCTISALYNPSCPGYAQAYYTQQCTINPLYDSGCPGYQQAYFNQQCELDGLYSKECPNYATTYTKKYLLGSTTATTDTIIKTDPVSIATTSTTTSNTSPISVTSVTSMISGGTSATTNTTITSSALSPSVATSATPATEDAKKSTTEVRSATAGSSGTTAKTRAEARAREVAKAAEKSATLEDQAATQGLVVGLMAFVPGFDSYSSTRITDINALEMQRRYGRPVVDNRSVLRQLSGASDQLHREMMEKQYGN